MNRKALGLLFAALSLSVVLTDLGYSSSSAPTIIKITTQLGKLNTRIVLETDAALTVTRTYYETNAIVLEFDRVDLTANPPVEMADDELVTGIKMEKTGPEHGRLRIQVREAVPYTVMPFDNRMIIELNRIQRLPGEIPVEPEVQHWLDQSPGTNAFMTKLNFEERDGELQFWAKLSGQTVSRVFTLEKPLRLVVDVYRAFYVEPASTVAVDRYGLRKVRVAQFQLRNPYPITRIVFDLDEPKYYELRSHSSSYSFDLAISLFRE